MADQRVLISIVNWNGAETILHCLRSLYDSRFRLFEVAIIDNASTDGSQDQIRAAFPGVTLIQNGDNLGFCGGQNQGMTLAIENNYEYVWVLNYDTLIDPDAMGSLVSELDGSPDVTMVSPTIYDNDEHGTLQYCGTTADLDRWSFKNWESIDLAIRAQDADPGAIFLWGTALMIRVSSLPKVGKLDERFFAYYEDYDLSLRVVRSGFLNRIVPAARIVHLGDHDSSQRPAHHVYFNTRNRGLFWRKHVARKKQAAFWREYLSGSLIRASGYEEVGDVERMNATLLGIWDALIGRGGRFDKTRKIAPGVTRLLMSHPYVLADILRGNFSAIIKRRFSNDH